MPVINFEAKLININSWDIIILPEEASAKLPSRGMTMVSGKINNFNFTAPLEPDGKGSHWFKPDENLIKNGEITAGQKINIEIEPLKEWPEPDIPDDLKAALENYSSALSEWNNTTPIARWDWIRWIRSTKNENTRKTRIEKTISKLTDGSRRPCCFNRSLCTEPFISKSGVLIQQKEA